MAWKNCTQGGYCLPAVQGSGKPDQEWAHLQGKGKRT